MNERRASPFIPSATKQSRPSSAFRQGNRTSAVETRTEDLFRFVGYTCLGEEFGEQHSLPDGVPISVRRSRSTRSTT